MHQASIGRILLIRFYIFKIIEQKMAMNRTASSPDSSQGPSKGGSDSSQDWVCIKCNNLNFSFRKKCNRCKVQSRQDNHQIIYLDYYYYSHYYQYPTHNYKKKTNSATVEHSCQPIKEPKTPVKKSFDSESSLSEKENNNLPSVSPLVKKYNNKIKDISCNGWKGEPIQKLFGEQIWNSEQFQEIDLNLMEKQLSATDDEQSRQEFFRSVEKMII